MAYLVLARKYRPQTFADIIGQEHVVRTLANAIKLDRVHHAFLFTGARGVGKTTSARVLARALNCEHGPTAEPCGACPGCRQITDGTSTDVLEIDGASNTSVDNVRELRENVSYLPSQGRFKIYIIDEVHMLSQAAFNALLKTLEEPPAHVKFIFATTEPHKIPVTILSRCQRFDFRRVSTHALGEHLRRVLAGEGVELGVAALSAIVREAQGSVRDALSMLDQVLSYAGRDLDDAVVIDALGVVDRQTVFDLCGAILARDAGCLLRLVGEIDARGHDLADAATLLVAHLRDLMVTQVTERTAEVLPERSPGELQALAEQASGRSRADLHRLFAQAVTVAEDVGRSPFPRISLEMGLLRLMEVEPSVDLSTLLERVECLLRGEVVTGGRSADRDAIREAAAKGAPAATHAPSASEVPATVPGPRGATVEPQPSPRPARQAGAGAAPEAAERATSALESAAQPSVPVQNQAPDSDRPSAPTPAQNDPLAGWRGFVDHVRASKPALAAMLEHGRLLAFEPQRVEAGFARGSIYLDTVRVPENRQALERALQEQQGESARLVLSELDDGAQTGAAPLAERSENRRLAAEKQIRDEALGHPAVRGAMATMGGEVKAFRSLTEPNAENDS